MIISQARTLLKGINDLIWPVVCMNCGQRLADKKELLCRKCWNDLLECTAGSFCSRCGRDISRYAMSQQDCPLCQNEKFHFDRIARAGIYDRSLREIILAFKAGKTELAEILGSLCSAAFTGTGLADETDIFVPVPLHWTRQLRRGYNQSYLLTKIIARGNRNKTLINRDLIRTKMTRQQTVMTSAQQRKKNVSGAFTVVNNSELLGKVVCMVDDIKTTGATLNECAKVLKKAGAKKVFALVVAVAGQGLKQRQI